MREGLENGTSPKSVDEYSLSNLDFSKLLDVSPIGSFTVTKTFILSNGNGTSATPTPRSPDDDSGTGGVTSNPVTIIPLSSHVAGYGYSTANVELLHMDEKDQTEDENEISSDEKQNP